MSEAIFTMDRNLGTDDQSRSLPPFTSEPFYLFRDFEVDARNREVRCNGADVDLGGRAFDLLVALLRTRGTVLDKRRIMAEVWPSTTVDDSNLRFQMACLRRALGSHRDLIKTVQGRGYLFAADCVVESAPRVPKVNASLNVRTMSTDEVDQPCSVAIVEDDRDVGEALEGLLRSFGYQVQIHASAQDLIEADPANYDCLVLDVWLPGCSGLELQDELSKAGVSTPIVFISGHADIHMSVRAMKAGAVDFLTKPVRNHELLSAIDAAVLRKARAVRFTHAEVARSH